jgi:hypothetical protein
MYSCIQCTHFGFKLLTPLIFFVTFDHLLLSNPVIKKCLYKQLVIHKILLYFYSQYMMICL